MTDYESCGQESGASTKTEKRAEFEAFEFRVPAEGAVRVENVSYGDESDDHVYVVSVESGIPFDCTCPAWEYHTSEGGCKHMFAVENQPAVTRAASTSDAERAEADGASAQQVATDGGAQQVATDVSDTDDNQTDDIDHEKRPQTDHWNQSVTHFDDGAVGAGEKCQCQSCGSRFEVAMVAATAENSRNWEEFYECQHCGARGSFRFNGKKDSREWTGQIAYPNPEGGR